MQRCLQLAALSNEKVYPNPMVGAVIVHGGKIIGEGYHQQYGGPHAEVVAIHSLKDRSLLKGSTLYVNLEPCCHQGKTPPCTDLIIESGISKVIIGGMDPNPLVAGKGSKKLEEQGIEVVSGILNKECSDLNERFFKRFSPGKQQMDFRIKWAESSDGFIGKQVYGSIKERELSNSVVKRWVHQMRSRADAVMVGTNTVLTDNPVLDNRFWYGNPPAVVIIDRTLKVPLTAELFKSDRKVFIFNEEKENISGNVLFIKTDFHKNDPLFWKAIIDSLFAHGIYSVLLEGGRYTINSFFNSGYSSQIIRIITPHTWFEGIKAPSSVGHLKETFFLGDNRVEIYFHDGF